MKKLLAGILTTVLVISVGTTSLRLRPAETERMPGMGETDARQWNAGRMGILRMQTGTACAITQRITTGMSMKTKTECATIREITVVL